MLSVIVSNSCFGKRPAARVMNILNLHFLPNIVFSYLGPQAISRAGFWSFVAAMCKRNPNLVVALAVDVGYNLH